MKSLSTSLLALALGISTVAASPFAPAIVKPRHHGEGHHRRQACEHGPEARHCWGEFSTDTNYYKQWPITGKVREYWLEVTEGTCAPDGVPRACMMYNGTVPGPLITADWGDDIVVHVTNKLSSNGTAVHWHGLHQRGSVEYDGVPGVTQCPITPQTSLTYKFRATQYGTTWYHSHFSLQYAEGLFGPLVIHGPSTDNYDIDLGTIMVHDWFHKTAFQTWHESARNGGPPPAPSNGIINGTNIYTCQASDPTTCVDSGKRFEAVFTQGKKHLIRIINSSNDAHFRFSIDGHTLKVVANDLVPIEPYTTNEVMIAIGQRYDIIVEANAEPGDYWLRSGMGCTSNTETVPIRDRVKGIVRYDPTSTLEPTTNSSMPDSSFCGDESYDLLKPYLKLNVSAPKIDTEILGTNRNGPWFQWTLNSSSLVLDWQDPTLERIADGSPVFPTSYNVIKIDKTGSNTTAEWYALVIQNPAAAFGIDHPIHLHGHDFWILAQNSTTWDGTTANWNFNNPPRRDTATMPANGHLVIGFELDNPGAWVVHCHIAWHASQGLSLEFVESMGSISMNPADLQVFRDQCTAWDNWRVNMPFPQDDSGI